MSCNICGKSLYKGYQKKNEKLLLVRRVVSSVAALIIISSPILVTEVRDDVERIVLANDARVVYTY